MNTLFLIFIYKMQFFNPVRRYGPSGVPADLRISLTPSGLAYPFIP